jgi:hypothetical protein
MGGEGMTHVWIYGWKELKRGGFFDMCKICGVGRVIGSTNIYIKHEDIERFLTTGKEVEVKDFIPCKENDASV